MTEQLVLFYIALAISLVALCASAYAMMRSGSDADVAELARHVAALRKSNRAEQMRRVREEAVEGRAASAPIDPKTGKPFPFGPLAIPPGEHFISPKEALRRRVFGERNAHKGNGGTS